MSEPGPPGPATPASRPAGKRVLLVEDERQVADTLALLLVIDRHRVDIAADGLEALERIAATAYDAILCDVRMPRLDGPGLYERLRQTRPELLPRIGFVTATAGEPATRAFLAASGAPWIEKPATLGDLRRLLQMVVGD
jgi:CheY-like chemotaxis protein